MGYLRAAVLRTAPRRVNRTNRDRVRDRSWVVVRTRGRPASGGGWVGADGPVDARVPRERRGADGVRGAVSTSGGGGLERRGRARGRVPVDRRDRSDGGDGRGPRGRS